MESIEIAVLLWSAGRDEVYGDVRSDLPGVHGRNVQPVLVLRPVGSRHRRDRSAQHHHSRRRRIRKVSNAHTPFYIWGGVNNEQCIISGRHIVGQLSVNEVKCGDLRENITQ